MPIPVNRCMLRIRVAYFIPMNIYELHTFAYYAFDAPDRFAARVQINC